MFFPDFKKHDKFAIDLAEEFIEKFPDTSHSEKQDKKVEKKREKAINAVYSKARDYSSKVKLGMYGKARIGNKFMWLLKEAGYEEVLVQAMTKDLLLSLSNNRNKD